jgi:hypothetical protein
MILQDRRINILVLPWSSVQCRTAKDKYIIKYQSTNAYNYKGLQKIGEYCKETVQYSISEWLSKSRVLKFSGRVR